VVGWLVGGVLRVYCCGGGADYGLPAVLQFFFQIEELSGRKTAVIGRLDGLRWGLLEPSRGAPKTLQFRKKIE
jgi:hypothetical protein